MLDEMLLRFIVTCDMTKRTWLAHVLLVTMPQSGCTCWNGCRPHCITKAHIAWW
jgi:hypothetical protein